MGGSPFIQNSNNSSTLSNLYLEITTAVVVPCGGRKRLFTHRYSAVNLIFSGSLGLLDSDIRNQYSTEADTRGREGCCISQYLSWIDSVKPRLLFSNLP